MEPTAIKYFNTYNELNSCMGEIKKKGFVINFPENFIANQINEEGVNFIDFISKELGFGINNQVATDYYIAITLDKGKYIVNAYHPV
jgi:hypothetical protein